MNNRDLPCVLLNIVLSAALVSACGDLLGPVGHESVIEPTGADDMLPDAEGCPCVADNDGIYVLSDDGEIWTFDPETRDFAYVTTVDCGGLADWVSMGVSRKGRAWIEHSSGDLFVVDLKDPGAPCKDPGFVHDDPRFPKFGLAFVANDAHDRCDRLYAYACPGPDVIGDDIGMLGVIDPLTVELGRIAPVDYGWGELAGTGDGRLFALEGHSPRILAEYDKTTGARKGGVTLPGLGEVKAFAFAYWGGRFWFFTEPDSQPGYSRVTALDLAGAGGDAELTVVVPDVPIRIIGAGVSTCAPPCSAGRVACPSPWG